MSNKPKVTWSYSSLNAFETCPKRFYLTRISKEVVEPQNEASLWGNRVHKALEDRLVARKPLPDGMEQFETLASTVVARAEGGRLEAEQKMALTADYRPAKWFDKSVWCRGIVDFVITKGEKAFIGDWKTGKPNPDSSQLKLTAAMTMHHKPWIKEVINAFVWLKTGTTTTEKFTREDVPAIWQEFAPRVQRMEIAMEEQKFPPRPSGLCRNYCPCTGCEHNGRYTGKS